MGSLNAVTLLPSIIIGPFAGVLIDRWNRKKIIILADFIRGTLITILGIITLLGLVKVWMVFIVGIINGICNAFFNPSIMSIKPDIVHKTKLYKANSITSFAQNGADMVGNSIGGILYVYAGVEYMFLINGLIYLFSGFTEMFMHIPNTNIKCTEVTFLKDLKSGFEYFLNFKTLRNIFLCASAINLFVSGSFVLFSPYFRETSFLGIEKYGFAMTTVSMGMFCGSIFLSIVDLKKQYKFKLYSISLLIFTVLFILIPIIKNYYLLLIILFISFMFNIIFNTIFQSMLMDLIPSEIRGKVLSLTTTIIKGLTPIGVFVAGVLANFFSITIIMLLFFILTFIVGIVCISIKGSKELIENN